MGGANSLAFTVVWNHFVGIPNLQKIVDMKLFRFLLPW
jgi:hypothetical protein